MQQDLCVSQLICTVCTYKSRGGAETHPLAKQDCMGAACKCMMGKFARGTVLDGHARTGLVPFQR